MRLSSEVIITLQIIQYIFTIIGFCYVSYSIICNLIAPPEGFEYDSDEDDNDSKRRSSESHQKTTSRYTDKTEEMRFEQECKKEV